MMKDTFLNRGLIWNLVKTTSPDPLLIPSLSSGDTVKEWFSSCEVFDDVCLMNPHAPIADWRLWDSQEHCSFQCRGWTHLRFARMKIVVFRDDICSIFNKNDVLLKSYRITRQGVPTVVLDF